MGKIITVAISGSFRKHLTEINETIKEFETHGVKVLSPKASHALNPNDEFVFLETDEATKPKALEQSHLEAIKKVDALYICNPGGYIGPSAIMELGWALALGKQIFCKEPAMDFMLKYFAGKVATPLQVKEKLSGTAK